jgi:CHAT domain-containing protein/tetratricopeptide (TPR) repeat protein
MRKIALSACLFLQILAPGRQHKRELAHKEPVAPPEERSFQPALVAMLHEGRILREKGRYSQAADLFQVGYRESKLRKDQHSEARFLLGIANCYFSQHHYREALQEYLAAKQALSSSIEPKWLFGIDVSLSSLYTQLGEYDAAIDVAKHALAEVPAREEDANRALALVVLATLYAQQGNAAAARELFRQGILEADRFGDSELRSNARDRLGCEFLLDGQLSQAEDLLLDAYRIRKLNRLPSLGESYRNLGILRMEQGELRSASALLDAAIAESKSPRGRIPKWRFYQARGRLRLAEGNIRQAHADFRLALELVRNYRLAVPASDAIRIGLEGLLQDVYAAFAETGSRLYFERSRAGLARETFEAVEENRAASLGARLNERPLLRRQLPPVYWERMAELESAESAAFLDSGDGPRKEMRRLRGSIIELESKAGGAGFTSRPDLLERTQRSLDGGTILLSFHLAQPDSSLWVVSKSGLWLYRLPDRAEVTRQVSLFRRAVLKGGGEAGSAGRELYRTLFGALGPEHRDKVRWLLSLDEGLFDLPFAALVIEEAPGKPVYLIERHSIRIVSGAGMWAARPSRENRIAGAFVGIGDAIYNTADVRWQGRINEQAPSWLIQKLGWSWKVNAAAPLTLGLSRLSGSGTEIDACAREWDSQPVLLKGRDATTQNIRRAVAARPAVIHFATHILQALERSSGAQIALSVSESGREELLGPAEIGGWNADAGLVVLSGCSSGAAAVRPGAGLMGLTRAWLMAGARAVVATEWSTPDDVGVFFRRFYQQLRRSPVHDPADALRAAQIEALRSHDWRSQPSFWAGYFALGNY